MYGRSAVRPRRPHLGLRRHPASTGGVLDLARDRLDHPLAAAIRLIYAARSTWPSTARAFASPMKRVIVRRAPLTIEHRAADASPVEPQRRRPWFSPRLHRPARCRCVAPYGPSRRGALSTPPPRGRSRGCPDMRVAAASPLRAVAPQRAVHAAAPRSSPPSPRHARRRCVAPSSRSAAARGPLCRPAR
nr:uncharacterized protein LOC127309114 [Lolium perenne]